MEFNKLNSDSYNYQYYKTWTSYKIPMQPTDPIKYTDTETLNSFYLAYYTEDGRLARFIKYIAEKRDIGLKKLSQGRSPYSKMYFKSISSESSEDIQGKEIDYASTEEHPIYYVGHIDESGSNIHLQKVERKIFFCDEYRYWPDGTLKERIMTKEDRSIIRFQYDEKGRKL